MRKILVFGSFDVLHDGHRSLFKQAKDHGDHLIVVVSRDSTYNDLRGYLPLHDENERLRSVADEPLVDQAVLGDMIDRYRVIRQHRPDTICLGYDQDSFTHGLRKRLDGLGLKETKVYRLKPFSPEKYKSSLLKKIGR